MEFPQTTFAGQKVSICNRYIELFRQEANEHPSGVKARSLRAELNALMPEAYNGHRLIWLRIKWKDVLSGNAKLGFPGVDLDKRSAATIKKDETYQALNIFYKYQREEAKVTVKNLLYERHKAMEECRKDTFHNPALADFKRVNGKLTLDLPSKNPMNESTNIAFAMRAMEKLDSSMDDEHRHAIGKVLADMKQKGYTSTTWDNKIDKELVRVNISMPAPPDPLEDFTTYTDDDPLGHTAITSSTIVGTGITRDERTLVYDDKGINNFDRNFNILVDTSISSVTGFSACVSWALTDDIDDINTLINANKSFLRLQHNSGTTYILIETHLGTQYSDFNAGLIDGQTYYNDIDRDEDIGSFGQLDNEIFSDSDRTLSVDILSVLLHAKLDLRYVFGLMSGDDNNAGSCNLTVSNLDLQEVAVFNPSWARNSNQIIEVSQ